MSLNCVGIVGNVLRLPSVRLISPFRRYFTRISPCKTVCHAQSSSKELSAMNERPAGQIDHVLSGMVTLVSVRYTRLYARREGRSRPLSGTKASPWLSGRSYSVLAGRPASRCMRPVGNGLCVVTGNCPPAHPRHVYGSARRSLIAVSLQRHTQLLSRDLIFGSTVINESPCGNRLCHNDVIMMI